MDWVPSLGLAPARMDGTAWKSGRSVLSSKVLVVEVQPVRAVSVPPHDEREPYTNKIQVCSCAVPSQTLEPSSVHWAEDVLSLCESRGFQGCARGSPWPHSDKEALRHALRVLPVPMPRRRGDLRPGVPLQGRMSEPARTSKLTKTRESCLGNPGGCSQPSLAYLDPYPLCHAEPPAGQDVHAIAR